MREIIDREIFDLLEGLYDRLVSELSIYVSDAQALCAIFIIIYLALKAYGMMVADEPLQIMPLLRPFALAMVIILWPSFVALLNYPTEVIADKGKDLLDDRIDLVNAIQTERAILMDSIAKELIERSAELERLDASHSEDDDFSVLGVDFTPIFDQMKGYYIIVISKMRHILMEIVEFLLITFFQVCSYLIYFLQIIFAGILVILGPFAFAFSILPGFKDAYITWIARYISVSLYSTIGYIVMSMSMLLIRYGLEKELLFLQYILSNELAFYAYVGTDWTRINFYIMALCVGGLSMLAIPIISTWIIPTSGIGGAISSMSRGARTIVSTSKALLK